MLERSAISMRELQKISASAIKELTHPIPIQSDGETIGLLTPLRRNAKFDAEQMRLIEEEARAWFNSLPKSNQDELERFMQEREGV